MEECGVAEPAPAETADAVGESAGAETAGAVVLEKGASAMTDEMRKTILELKGLL